MAMAEAMSDCTEQMLERWDRTASLGETIDIVAEMMALTQAIIVGRCSAPTSARRRRLSIARGRSSIGASGKRSGRRNWRRRCRCPPIAGSGGRCGELDTVVYQIIADRRQCGRDESDLLSMFLAARDDETGAGMTDRQLRDEVLTMLLAGHETTSLALSWTYYCCRGIPTSRGASRTKSIA